MRAPRSAYLFLAIGLAAASQSGNLVRIGNAHPVAMAAWRLGLASVLLAPVAGRQWASLARLTWREWLLLVLAGVALAAHLIAWIAAVQLTTVATAAILFAVNPVLTATAAHYLFGEKVSGRLLLSIGLGLVGIAILGWNDAKLDPAHASGDAMALLCSAFFTVYFLAGKRLRRVLATPVYVASIYGVAALTAFGALAWKALPLITYDSRTWVCFALLAVVPTMIGHTSFNNALRYLDAGWISSATLSEPLLAGLVAWLAWNEVPTVWTAVGYSVIAVSVAILAWEGWWAPHRRVGKRVMGVGGG